MFFSGSFSGYVDPDKTRGPLPAEQVWGVLEIRKLWASRRRVKTWPVSFCDRRLGRESPPKKNSDYPKSMISIHRLLKMTDPYIALWNNTYLTWVVNKYPSFTQPTLRGLFFFMAQTGETFQGRKAHSKHLVFEKKMPSNTSGASESHEWKSSASQLHFGGGFKSEFIPKIVGESGSMGEGSPLPSFFSWRFVRDHRDHSKIRYMGVARLAIDPFQVVPGIDQRHFVILHADKSSCLFLKKRPCGLNFLRSGPLGKCLPGRLSHQAAHNMHRVRYLKKRRETIPKRQPDSQPTGMAKPPTV